MAKAVILKSIKKTYSREPILEIEEMTLDTGEVLAISGQNGAGKSTLLRIIGLLEPPDVGYDQFLIFGQEPSWRNHTPLRRRIAIVFQAPYMFNRSVYENIALGLRWRRLDVTEIDERVRELSDLLEIDYLDQAARELSRGQAQRVALARSMALHPEMLLLDEPLSALDTNIRAKLLANLKETLAKTGQTAIYITHDETEAELIADHRQILISGKIGR